MLPRLVPHILLALCLAVLLAACANATPPFERQAWEGTTTTAEGTFPLTIATTLTAGGGWTGTYTVERTPPFTGDVDATLAAGVLEGVLVVSDACTFELVGTVSDDALDATFAPTECSGGASGTWRATRTAPDPAANDTGTPTTGDATFDGAAAFDTAIFR